MASTSADPTDSNRIVSNKVKMLRQEQQLTLKELSVRSSVSHGLLSNLEAGRANPSLSTLMKISRVLGIPLSTLFEPLANGHFEQGGVPAGSEQAPELSIVRRDQRKVLSFHNSALKFNILTPDLQRNLQVVETVLPAGFDGSDSPFRHIGEEVVHVVRGQVEVHLGSVCSMLSEGDTISFNPDFEHWYQNPTSDLATLISVSTPPSL